MGSSHDSTAGRAGTPEPPEPSRAWVLVRSLLGLVAGLGVAGALMWKLGVSPAAVARGVALAPLWVVAACVASGFVNQALHALRWHAVMRPVLGLGYADAYRAQIVGYLFNQLIPARGGDLLRVQYLGRRTGKSRATLLGTELIDRWLDLWAPIPTILVIALFTDVPAWVWKAVALFGTLAVGLAITLIALGRRGYAPRHGSRFAVAFASFRSGIAAFRSRRTWLIALALAPLPWLWEAMVIHAVLLGFGVHLGLAPAFCVLVGFNAATALPTPGAIGTMDAAGTAALVWFGVDPSKALAFMVVYHLAQLLPGAATGAAIVVGQGGRLFAPAAPAKGR